jgi:hypothetical protein
MCGIRDFSYLPVGFLLFAWRIVFKRIKNLFYAQSFYVYKTLAGISDDIPVLSSTLDFVRGNGKTQLK